MPINNSISNKNFWRGFWGAIVFLLIIYISAVFKVNDTDNKNNKILLSADGKHVVLSDGILELYKQIMPTFFANINKELGEKVKSEIETLIDKKIDAVFNPVYGQIPKFADFHFSVTGEYTEIIAALSGDMSNRVLDVLFKEVGFERNLQNELDEINRLSKDKVSGAVKRINDDFQSKMELGNDDMNLLTKTLHLTDQDLRNRFYSREFSTIKGADVVMGISVTGTVLAKVMGKKLATKVAAKTAIKASAKGGSILGGAGGGALTCAVGGPVASALCGLLGAAVVWFAVDKVIIEIDEYFNRDYFEQELRNLVDEQKQEIKKGLKDYYSIVIATLADEQKNKIKSGVTPKDLITN